MLIRWEAQQGHVDVKQSQFECTDTAHCHACMCTFKVPLGIRDVAADLRSTLKQLLMGEGIGC